MNNLWYWDLPKDYYIFQKSLSLLSLSLYFSAYANRRWRRNLQSCWNAVRLIAVHFCNKDNKVCDLDGFLLRVKCEIVRKWLLTVLQIWDPLTTQIFALIAYAMLLIIANQRRLFIWIIDTEIATKFGNFEIPSKLEKCCLKCFLNRNNRHFIEIWLYWAGQKIIGFLR